MSHALALTRDDTIAPLKGPQKAAILCMVLGAESAAMITKKLSPEDVEAISFEIARMDRVSGEAAERVLTEWLDIMTAADSLAAGGIDYARELLEKAFGAGKSSTMLRRIQLQLADNAGLQRLRNADPQQLGNMMRGEHPQTVALILAHLEPAHTASVLKELNPSLGSEVAIRMAKMEKVSPDMLQLIERSILAESDLTPTQGASASGGPAAVAAILNMLQPALLKIILEGLSENDAELGEQIKNLMFVFEDLVGLDDKSLQRLLREVDSRELSVALKRASNEVRNKIMGAMSQRAVQALKEEIEMLGPVRKADVDKAQVNIIAALRGLEEAGEIVLNGGGDDLL
ncbi:MAG: flagellar motor switch protein FliG [Gemmatimonadetes bacterium]|nr:flagellar motor switch protein FliG [Gemmatimonadota bacterium]